MVKVKGKSISISKGDTMNLIITLTADVPNPGTLARFTVKRRPEDEVPVIVKEDLVSEELTVGFNFTSEDTNIRAGVYNWDIRFIYEDGKVVTPMLPSPFEIFETIGDVTDD